MKKKKQKEKNIIISEYVDKYALEPYEIINEFNNYLDLEDGSQLTQKQIYEIKNLCEEHPIIKILCSAMCSQGYNSF